MAGTTTSSLDNSGEPSGTRRDLLIQFNSAIDDLADFLPLSVNSPAVGNVGAGEDDLMTYAMAANVLNAASNGVRICAWGSAANNANAKTLKLYLGTATIISQSLTASIAGKWVIDAVVLRTGSDTQDIFGVIHESTATLSATDKSAIEIGTATQDEDAAITIKCTGEATTTNDIVQEGFVITALRVAGDLGAAKIGDMAGTAITV